jgi:hypothetical protein
MPISKEQLGNIIASKAAALCRPEYDNAKSVSRGNVSEGFGGPSPSDYDGDADRWDAMFSDSAYEDYAPAQGSRDIQYSNAGAARSQMPDAIKKSMMENRIDVSGLGNSSVLDSLGVKGKPTTAPTQRKKQVVNEQVTTQQYVPQVGGVDYSIIKAIVSECIREYFEKQPLNESSIKTIALKGGTISLVDNGGNIYRAKLEKVGTTKDSKK